MGHLGGGVDRALSRRVVERGVTEAAHGEGIDRPLRVDVQFVGRPDGESDTEGPGQLRGDRRGLRDDRQVGVSEHLVAPAGDRLVGGGEETPEHVADTVMKRGLLCPGEVEGTRAVVQEGRIAGPQGGGNEGVGLVAGGADRVEAVGPRNATSGRCGRGAGWRPGRRTARRDAATSTSNLGRPARPVRCATEQRRRSPPRRRRVALRTHRRRRCVAPSWNGHYSRERFRNRYAGTATGRRRHDTRVSEKRSHEDDDDRHC